MAGAQQPGYLQDAPDELDASQTLPEFKDKRVDRDEYAIHAARRQLDAQRREGNALAIRGDDGGGIGDIPGAPSGGEQRLRAGTGGWIPEDDESVWSYERIQEYGTAPTQLESQEKQRQQEWSEELQVARGRACNVHTTWPSNVLGMNVVANEMQLAQFSPLGEAMEFELNPPVWTPMRSNSSNRRMSYMNGVHPSLDTGENYWYNFRTGEVALEDPTLNPEDAPDPDSEPDEPPHEKFLRQGRSGKFALDGSTFLEHEEDKRKQRREERKKAAEEQDIDLCDMPDEEEEEPEYDGVDDGRCALDWSMVREYDGIVRLDKKPSKGLDITFEVRVSRGPDYEAPLGLTLDHAEHGSALVVTRISELGMIHKWNCANGNLRVRVKDFIVGVNSVLGRPYKMLKEMSKPQEEVELRIVRRLKAIHWIGADFGAVSGNFVKRPNHLPQEFGRVTLHE